MGPKEKIRKDGKETIQLYTFKIGELRNVFEMTAGEHVILTRETLTG